MRARPPTAAICSIVLGLSPLVLLLDVARHGLEGRMLVHMLVEFPWLMIAGAVAARALVKKSATSDRAIARIDWRGLLGLVFMSCVAALWMIPSALDAALVNPAVAALKVVSWWLAGALVALAWARTDPVVRMFFLGNLAWMFATAGLLFTEAEQRLCVNYLLDEQLLTGRALIGVSVGILLYLVRSASSATDPDFQAAR
jgi:hypothetical protein